VPNDEPFPRETVRDLIGIARALYLALHALGPTYANQLSRVAAVGSKLARALDKASKGGPGTWNQTTAWIMAEQAAKELGELVDVYLPAKALISASGSRLKKRS
jgi:hypothetical protein